MTYRAEKVKWLDKDEIERDAKQLVQTAFPNRKPFTPIDPERLILKLQQQDNKLFFRCAELSDGLDGKYEISKNGYRVITINENLYKRNTPSLGFVTFHEIGHYIYHTPYLEKVLQRRNIIGAEFPSTNSRKLFSNYDSAEWQADYFSGAVGIPKEEIEAKHYTMFDNLGILGKFKDNTALYRYIGKDATRDMLYKWAEKIQVSPFSLSIRMFKLGLLDAGGRSFISYDRKSGKVIEGFAY